MQSVLNGVAYCIALGGKDYITKNMFAYSEIFVGAVGPHAPLQNVRGILTKVDLFPHSNLFRESRGTFWGATHP